MALDGKASCAMPVWMKVGGSMATAILFAIILWIHFTMPKYSMTVSEGFTILIMACYTMGFDYFLIQALKGRKTK
jgi:hypothetical protein